MTVTLVQPYDPTWPSHFERIKLFLKPALSVADCVIEHVGSTAIPGMAAKPIIDIDIVAGPTDFPEVKEGLERLGYIHQGDKGIPQREAFDLVDAESRARLPEHHLYVCEEGAHELHKHIAFRDLMRQHPELREKLSRLKRELCVRHNNDRQAYIDGKADMVKEITRLAMESDEIIIEAMRPADIAEVCALLYAIPELGVARSFDTQERMSAYLERNPGFSTVARKGDRIVGAVMCGHDGRRGSFYHTAVLPEFRRQCLAEGMVERSLSCLREAGITTAFVFTHEKNVTAQAFWRGTGWEHCPWVQYHYRDFAEDS